MVASLPAPFSLGAAAHLGTGSLRRGGMQKLSVMALTALVYAALTGILPSPATAAAPAASACTTWTPVSGSGSDVSFLSPTDGWLVQGTSINHWDGSTWAAVSASVPGTLTGVGGHSSSDVWAVGSATSGGPLIEHWNGSAWSIVSSPVSSGSLSAVSATSSTDAWAVGNDGGQDQTLALHWNGSSWSSVPMPVFYPGFAGKVLNDVAAISAHNAWAVGTYLDDVNDHRPVTEHWDGSQWSITDAGTANGGGLDALQAISATDIWAVGHLGDSNHGATVSAFAEHWDGSSWTHYQVPAPTGFTFYEPTLVGVHAAGSGDVWVGGNVDGERTGLDGFFSHWNGTDWTTSDPLPDGSELNALAGSGSSEIQAVGDSFMARYGCLTNNTRLAASVSQSDVVVGDPISYTFTVSAGAKVGATGTSLVISLPSSETATSVTPQQGTCAGQTTITCDLGTLLAGGSIQVLVETTTTETGPATTTGATAADQPDSDPSNNSVSVSVRIQPASPGTPAYHFVLPSRLSTGDPARLPEDTTWTASSSPNICSYQARVSTNGGKYVSIAVSPATATDVQARVRVGSTYRFEARAVDCSHVASAWSIGPKFTVDGFQEAAASYSGTRRTWVNSTLTGAWGGTVDHTTTAGASATFQFFGRNIAWVGTKGPKYSKADIYIDGVLTKTIDCYAASTSTRQVLFRYGWPSSGPHTIRIVDDVTANRPRIDVDGFVAYR
jgi:hypothetical protein